MQPEAHGAGVALVQEAGHDRLERDFAAERCGAASAAWRRGRHARAHLRHAVGGEQAVGVPAPSQPGPSASAWAITAAAPSASTSSGGSAAGGGCAAAVRVPRGVAQRASGVLGRGEDRDVGLAGGGARSARPGS